MTWIIFACLWLLAFVFTDFAFKFIWLSVLCSVWSLCFCYPSFCLLCFRDICLLTYLRFCVCYGFVFWFQLSFPSQVLCCVVSLEDCSASLCFCYPSFCLLCFRDICLLTYLRFCVCYGFVFWFQLSFPSQVLCCVVSLEDCSASVCFCYPSFCFLYHFRYLLTCLLVFVINTYFNVSTLYVLWCDWL